MTFRDLEKFKYFVCKYLDPKKPLKFLEIGSKDEMSPKRRDMTFRRYTKRMILWDYVGLDIISGKNVDIVSKDFYHYPFPDGSFDIVVSGNTLEHVEDIYQVAKEIGRLTRWLVFITVPNSCPFHEYPKDCWRIWPDGLRFLMEKIANLKILEIGTYRGQTFCIASKNNFASIKK